MKPLAFKVRTQGHYTGVNGGDIKKGGGGAEQYGMKIKLLLLPQPKTNGCVRHKSKTIIPITHLK